MLMDAWRYFRMMPSQFNELTPREYTLLNRAENEAMYDSMERESRIAIMHGRANNPNDKKGISATDLFQRPKDPEAIKREEEEKQAALEWRNNLINSLDMSALIDE